MQFLSIQAFVPSGPDFKKSVAFFEALGFRVDWDEGGYVGFEKDSCRFILQDYDNASFAQNLMLTIRVSDAAAFRAMVLEKRLPQTFGIKIGEVTQEPYGKEVNIIDIAGVCWHFVE